MALFRGIQEYIALDANNITLVFDSGNIASNSGNIFIYSCVPLKAIQYYIIILSIKMKYIPLQSCRHLMCCDRCNNKR